MPVDVLVLNNDEFFSIDPARHKWHYLPIVVFADVAVFVELVIILYKFHDKTTDEIREEYLTYIDCKTICMYLLDEKMMWRY